MRTITTSSLPEVGITIYNVNKSECFTPSWDELSLDSTGLASLYTSDAFMERAKYNDGIVHQFVLLLLLALFVSLTLHLKVVSLFFKLSCNLRLEMCISTSSSSSTWLKLPLLLRRWKQVVI